MPSPFGPLTVIVNPHAGKRHVGEEVPELERTLRARDLPYTLVTTEGRGDATRSAREALLGGGRFLVAVGGDGTVPAGVVAEGVVEVPLDLDRPDEVVRAVLAPGRPG